MGCCPNIQIIRPPKSSGRPIPIWPPYHTSAFKPPSLFKSSSSPSPSSHSRRSHSISFQPASPIQSLSPSSHRRHSNHPLNSSRRCLRVIVVDPNRRHSSHRLHSSRRRLRAIVVDPIPSIIAIPATVSIPASSPSRSIHMGGTKLLESLKIKECDRFPSQVTGYCNWESIRLIKSHLTPKQLELFGVTCFGRFLNMGDMVLSGQFCHHILLRECHVKNANENASSLWYDVGNGVIRFNLVEFCYVSGLTFGAYSESTLEIFKRKDSKLRRSYFQDSKVHVKMIIDWFRNLGPNNKYSDYDIVKLALILILEMTLVGKDDRTSILYWALELVDELDAFNKFQWGSFSYDRTFNSLSTCLLGRDDKFKNKFIDKLKEKVDGSVKRKVERYNVYGFVTAFQLTIYKNLGPSDEEARKPYWMGMDQLQYVSPNVDGYGDEEDDDDEDGLTKSNHISKYICFVYSNSRKVVNCNQG
ncbi:hypothetical protein Ddye_032025 [Dipteronia dyeriana]|uniref:DUF1985 domain-containing protein n=1 Tax=Dipteronia dyeriana TaxID=168575 RepID=A0AAD9WP69_9ROSI|nr:hypothetical protein Ddye_032025 [Dipteronia dyeriana]